MTRESPQFKLRMPDDLHGEIAECARISGRSMNAEIVHRLSQSIGDAAKGGQAAEALATIIQRLEEIERQIGVNNGREAKPPGKRAAAKKGK